MTRERTVPGRGYERGESNIDAGLRLCLQLESPEDTSGGFSLSRERGKIEGS